MPERTAADHHRVDNDRAEHDRGDSDRRRSPRFTCGGHAEINCLPSTGILLPAAIRDLSLHGCWVDTSRPIDCGARAEIVVRVNAASFRAVGEVRAIRGRAGAGLEFVHLSAGGKDMLTDLIADLARMQALMNKLKADRREMDAESFRKELEDGKYQAEMLSERFPFLRNILPAENLRGSAEASQVTAGKNRTAEGTSLVIAVDLFG
jgi:PilZ domain